MCSQILYIFLYLKQINFNDQVNCIHSLVLKVKKRTHQIGINIEFMYSCRFSSQLRNNCADRVKHKSKVSLCLAFNSQQKSVSKEITYKAHSSL